MAAKIGRNSPCPCGSGKKYKKCCLMRREESAVKLPISHQVPTPPITQEISVSTFPGEPATITMVPFFAPGDPRNTNEPKGLPGKYQAGIVLCRPGRLEVGERAVKFSDQLIGDSHIAITQPAIVPASMPNAVCIRIRAVTDAGSFVFDGKPNANGYLGKLVSDPFDAENFDDALNKAYHAVAPSLSNWSAHLDVPVQIMQIDAIELRTGAARTKFQTPPLEVRFAVEAEPKLESEFRYYAGLYREALNSNSPAYRFLCFYKIIEGIRARRNRLARETRLSGGRPQRFKFEEVPSELSQAVPWLNSVYGIREWSQLTLDQVLPAHVRGKSFGWIIESVLRPLRVEVAHGILDSGELGMSPDDMLKIERVNSLLPLTRTVVRWLLKNTFRDQFMHHMPDPDAEKPTKS